MNSPKHFAPINSEMVKPVLQRIAKLDQKDLVKHGVWSDLAELSTKTTLSGIEAHPDGIYQADPNTFEAVATVYLTLNFAKQKAFANGFPAHINGTMTPSGEIKIDTIKVDTSSLEPK
jgi:hypothetical protein